MLTLTNSAVDAIQELTTQPGLPDDSGIRIKPTEPGEATSTFQIDVREAPEEDDQIVERGGARVFLDPDVADVFSDQTLDALVVGDTFQFRLAGQAS